MTDARGSWTYRELADHSHRFSAWLRERGIGPGDRLVVQLPSTRELTAMLYGASRSGVTFVPLNPAMKPFHLESVLANAEPALVVVPGTVRAERASLTPAPVLDMETVWARTVATDYAPAAGDDAAKVRPDDIAVLVYTSGSTSAPKAVMCPHAQMTFASRSIQQVLDYRADDVVFCRFPLSWDYGLYKVLLAALGRSEIVLAGEESDLVLVKRMRETGATVVPIVPSLAAMIATLASRDTEPAPPVRLFTNTGAALPDATITALRENFPGVRVVRQFGQTECKRISIMPPGMDGEKPGSVGLPLPGTEVRILDPEGRALPAGETGEIIAAGPHVMPGYWCAPELTDKAFRPDPVTGGLLLHTGDFGSLDEDGFLYFEGRRDDMFKRKGIRMSVLEIEGAAMAVPGVRAAAAVPPSDTHDLALFVEADLAPQVVLRELTKLLEPQKVPGVCRVLKEFPLTLHGKNARQVLTEMLAGSHQ
ncbi:AMP-binding protein [Streptomyces sp. NBC_01754]|uniref:AMP-binding protein n=1 Tax=Streptomyces sp. NBC_01754 TaxID=2975930 RepID=UPI002DDB80AF|nr:AMP-binding protein [Streptomyces sp. NBC_01754]